jgi:Fe-S-cluster containining protein
MRTVSHRRLGDLLHAFSASIEEGAPLPRLDRDEAIAITEGLHEQMEGGTEARDREVVELGHTIACARGCYYCCAQIIVTAEAEAVMVARWLEQPEQAAVRARFLAAHAAWKAAGADIIEESAAAAAARDTPRLRRIAATTMRGGLLCPFNHEGACSIYPVRPNLCRKVHALDSADPCKFDGVGAVLDFVPITDFLQRIRPLERAMHTVLRGDAPEGPLADRVVALLAERPVGRNEPCSCGSGKKYKKCCGA